MEDQYKTKEQLINELTEIRHRMTELEKSEAERKRAEEALRESKERYRIITDCVEDIVWQLDLRLHFVYVSPAVERVLGYTPQEACGLYVVDLLDEDGLVRMREVIQNRSERKTDFNILNEYRMRHKDGHWVDVEVLSSPLFDAEGHPTGFVGITRDIGMRKRAEEEFKNTSEQLRALTARLQSAREEERTQIAREIHDELGQALTALKMDLFWMSKKLPRDQKPLHEKVRSMSQLLDTTVKTVKRISTQLRPGLLDDLGLAAAIEWQAEEFQNRTGIKCSATVESDDIVLDEKLSTALFRIFQETLTNVARHSHATRVKVSLRQKATKLELKVEDNGKGITEKEISRPKSFGIIGMRERIYPWKGELKISGIPGKGTTVTVTIPIKKEAVISDQ